MAPRIDLLECLADVFVGGVLSTLSALVIGFVSAHFLAELNAIHAFREGNRRAQLSFFALLADQASQPLDLENLDPDAMLNAMIASFDGDQGAKPSAKMADQGC
jgi:hypothetical protein